MDRLAEPLAPDDAHKVISAAGDTWRLEIDSMDLGAKLVTIQRCNALIASTTALKGGRLRVATSGTATTTRGFSSCLVR